MLRTFNRPCLSRRHSGFTLIEIMVVVVIMGVLAALLVPRLMGRTDDARILAAKQDIATLMQALKLYRLDNQRYPTTEQRSLGKHLSIYVAGHAQRSGYFFLWRRWSARRDRQ